jgi:HEAT repeat protein
VVTSAQNQNIAQLEILVRDFNILRKTISHYPPGHPSREPALGRLRDDLNALIGANQEVALTVTSDGIEYCGFLHDQTSPSLKKFSDHLHKFGIHKISIAKDVQLKELEILLEILNANPIIYQVQRNLSQEFLEKGVNKIRIDQIDFAKLLRQESSPATELKRQRSSLYYILLTSDADFSPEEIESLYQMAHTGGDERGEKAIHAFKLDVMAAAIALEKRLSKRLVSLYSHLFPQNEERECNIDSIKEIMDERWMDVLKDVSWSKIRDSLLSDTGEKKYIPQSYLETLEVLLDDKDGGAGGRVTWQEDRTKKLCEMVRIALEILKMETNDHDCATISRQINQRINELISLGEFELVDEVVERYSNSRLGLQPLLDSGVLEQLWSALKDLRGDNHSKALNVLTVFKQKTVDFLLDKLRDEKDEREKQLIIDVIAEFGALALTPIVERLNDYDRDFLCLLLGLLEQVADETVINRVGVLITHEDSDVRYGVVKLLSRFRHPVTWKIMAEALDDLDEDVRSFVRVSLANARDRSAIPYILKLLEDWKPWRRERIGALDAMKTLGRLKATDAIPILRKMAYLRWYWNPFFGNSETKRIASWALSEIAEGNSGHE